MVQSTDRNVAATPRSLISIVIATLNAAHHLAGCLESLATQTFHSFEVIVADGVSGDGTVDVAEALRARLPALRVDARKDGGVYEAINRGIGLATGHWIYVLGADDRLADSAVLERLAETLCRTRADIVYGDVEMNGANQWVVSGERYPGPVGIAFLSRRNICQQSMFYRRRALLEDGCFNARYRLCADWAYLLGAYNRRRIERVDIVVCLYATDGLSSRGPDRVMSADMPALLGRAIARRPFDSELRHIKPAVRSSLKTAVRDMAALRAVSLMLAYTWASIDAS